ncbi:hypothetical protein H9L13_10300 [Sphingomonas lutea]|uniref:Winged helix-turn-helix transcriptional regulator n=1 Tax=Sphingomonas lutea TaxID=1045317 RepID=A0A7G9SGP3_9SPHN|nr:MarR family winged helix-turn-helix transcriptional regulator [Sphingomonas lutea]QNN67018.1 hypothetical protein H9L13_10300 [Sphingomonas lutea]
MNAYPIGSSTVPYSDGAPVLVTGSGQAAINRAAAFVEATGARVGGRITLDEASRRIADQASAAAVWIELEEDCGPALDVLLKQVEFDVEAGRYAAVVGVTADLIDRVVGNIDDPGIEVVVDGQEFERATALALAIGNSRRPLRVSDVAAEKNAQRIRQLSEEVSRIASTLARLSEGPSLPTPRPVMTEGDDVPPVSAETVRSVIRARRLRSRYFSEELFADPAWDMLLDLLQAEIAHLRVPVSSLCIAAAVPATTALRWLKTMVQQNVFMRRADPHDGRRVFVELAPQTSHALRRYFAEVDSTVPVI